MNDCGTVGDDKRDEHETILIIQNEESVQEVWDSAKRIRCPPVTTRKKIIKTVSFNPFTVQRLVIDEPTVRKEEETKLECWMDILVGEGPCGYVVQDKVKIGEQLNAMIYVKDGGAKYDILVKECYAHDSEDLNALEGLSVQLSDDRGCPRKEKLMGLFQKTEQTCSSGADLVAFAPISAFKFADRPDVFLTCVVELCPGLCDHCPDSSNITTVTAPPDFKCTPDLVGLDYRCPKSTTPIPFSCTPNLVGRDPRCPTPPPPPPPPPPSFRCTTALVGRDPRCPLPPPPPPPPPVVCTPALQGKDPRCKPKHCEYDPAGPGCGITTEELERHPFHVRSKGTSTGRKRITGSLPTNSRHSRTRRDTSKNIIISGVGTGFHFK